MDNQEIRRILNGIKNGTRSCEEVEKILSQKIAEDIAHKQADFQMAFELVQELTLQGNEENVIQTIFHIINRLFSPRKQFFFSMKEGNLVKVESNPPNMELNDKEISERINFEELYQTNEQEDGFIIKVRYNEKIIGYLDIREIQFPEYQKKYLNLALSLTRIFGLAIHNARIYQTLSRTLKELKRSNEELEQFAYIISHDLKQPLTNIISSSSLMKHLIDEKKWDALEKLSSIVEGSAEELNAMIDDFLNYARIGKSKDRETMVDLNEVLTKVRENLKSLINNSDAAIEVQDLPEVRANEIELIQLFQNLV